MSFSQFTEAIKQTANEKGITVIEIKIIPTKEDYCGFPISDIGSVL